jgi:WD40 repeat protein
VNLPSVALLTTGLVALSLSASHGADLSFATPDGLFRLGPNNGDRQTLLTGGDRPFNSLAWSSDGLRLAVVQSYGEVYRLSPGAPDPELVFSSDCPRPPNLAVAWQTTSPTLIIKEQCPATTPGLPVQTRLYRSSATGGVTPAIALPENLTSDVFLSPDGSQVAYAAGDHIFVVGLEDASPQRVTQTPGIYGAAGSPLAWSPDGTRLAFYEGNYPLQRLNVVGIDGSDRRLLTPDPDFQIYRSRLLWSPDSRYIAFYRPHNPPFSNQEVVALVSIASGETQVLTRPGFYDALSWAPNSQQLALASGVQAGRQALFKLDLATQEFTALTSQPLQTILDSQWAPDGDWIAFTATPDDDPFGTQVLYRVRPDGSQLAPLTGDDEYVYPFTWVSAPASN